MHAVLFGSNTHAYYLNKTANKVLISHIYMTTPKTFRQDDF